MARKYSAIQILRFVAASFVVVDHAILAAIQHWPNVERLSPIAWSFGEVGVVVFFGISGFIMATTQYESFGSFRRSLDFFLRRIIRIAPIYAIATTLEYIHKLHAGPAYSFGNYIRSLLFIPYIGEGGLYRPILGQGWTLNYEMFFYLIFAISLCLKRSAGMLLSAAFFCLMAVLSGSFVSNNPTIAFYLNHILLYFVCGMIVGIIKKHQGRSTSRLFMPMFALVLLMVLACVSFVLLKESYFLVPGLLSVFVCVYVGASCQPERSSKLQAVLERLGDASYSTYLFHGFAVGAIRLLTLRLADNSYFSAIMVVVLSIVVANLAGLIAYIYVELPISRLLHGRGRLFQRAPIAG